MPDMTAPTNIEDLGSTYQRQAANLQWITILWMFAEAAVAIFAAIRARSVALLGFGTDSGIELASALVVFFRFQKESRISETKAARITGILLFALAVFIVANSILALISTNFQPEPSYLGIALLIVSAFAMPLLAKRKRSLAAKMHSGSLNADATQSAMCGYLALIALAGLILNAVFKIAWADPVAALLLVPIVVREAWEAVQGKPCSCSESE